jgi:L-lactate dehydrogenase complex protein LldG
VSGDAPVLRRVAERLRRASRSPDHAGPDPAAAPPRADPPPVHDPPALMTQFADAWTALAGHVHEAHDASEAAGIVAAICEAHGARRLLAWDEPRLAVPGVAAALATFGLSIDPGEIPREPGRRAARVRELAEIQVGLTGAAGAIAESGTIAVVSGPGRSRLASLLPPVHVALLHLDRIHPTLADFLAAHPTIADEGSNLVLITGPSRTADIEMTLTRGVHGPGEVHVIFVNAERGMRNAE